MNSTHFDNADCKHYVLALKPVLYPNLEEYFTFQVGFAVWFEKYTCLDRQGELTVVIDVLKNQNFLSLPFFGHPTAKNKI